MKGAFAFAAKVACLCVLAVFQIAFGNHDLFPNLPLVFAFFCGAKHGLKTFFPIVLCGFAMDVLSWGLTGPHVLSLTGTFFAARKISQVFDLLRPVLFSGFVFVCSNMAFVIIAVSHAVVSGNTFETSPSTVFVQALSNTAAAAALFHLSRLAGRKNERA